MKEGILQRVSRLAAAVDDGVALGIHLYDGDLGQRHFVESRDMALLVEFGNAILERVTTVFWIHLPVPKSPVDAAYFAPLGQLELSSAELYLGLLHPNVEEGTKKRIKAASQFARRFGLATVCGLGRSSLAELDSILGIAKRVQGAKGGSDGIQWRDIVLMAYLRSMQWLRKIEAKSLIERWSEKVEVFQRNSPG